MAVLGEKPMAIDRITASAFPSRPATTPTCHPTNHPGRGIVDGNGRPQGLPVLEHGDFRACPGSPTARGPPVTRDSATGDVAFRLSEGRRHPELWISRLNSPACTTPVRRFAAALTSGRRTVRGHRVSLALRCRELASPSSMPVYPGAFSDFRRSCISGLRQSPSPSGPPAPRPVGTMPISLADRTGKRGISRFSLTEVPHVPRISDRAGSAHDSRNNAVSDVAFRPP